MKLPRFIPADKANHRARGSDVAGIFSAIVAAAVWLLSSSLMWTALAATVSAPLSAYVAGVAVERWQARQNRVSAAHGGSDLYTVDRLDAWATLRGGVPVMLPMVVVLLLVLSQ